MMLRWIPDILREEHFRPLARLYDDVENEPPGEFPQVIFVEPAYTDAPHIGVACDDHAPSAIKGGQEFLLEVYRALTRVPDVWKGAVMVVTYDEHGGFFDHVSPPALRTEPPPGALYQRAIFMCAAHAQRTESFEQWLLSSLGGRQRLDLHCQNLRRRQRPFDPEMFFGTEAFLNNV